MRDERPDFIVPEIEVIATDTVEFEGEGYTVIPTARAAQLTMNREGIRRLAAEELGILHQLLNLPRMKQSSSCGFTCRFSSRCQTHYELIRKRTELSHRHGGVRKARQAAQEGARGGAGSHRRV